MNAKTLTVAAIRGGAGKTTTADTLAHVAAMDGQKVLLIDLDPQCSLTLWEGQNPADPGIYDAMTGAKPIEHVIKQVNDVSIATANADLLAIRPKPNIIEILSKTLEPVKSQFQVIIVDTPPTVGLLQDTAIYAANGLLITLEADADSLEGMYALSDIADHIRALGSDVKSIGSVITRYDGRSNLNRFYRDQMTDICRASGYPIRGVIRSGIAAKEARSFRRPLTEYARKSKPCQDYIDLWHEIFSHGRLKGGN